MGAAVKSCSAGTAFKESFPAARRGLYNGIVRPGRQAGRRWVHLIPVGPNSIPSAAAAVSSDGMGGGKICRKKHKIGRAGFLARGLA